MLPRRRHAVCEHIVAVHDFIVIIYYVALIWEKGVVSRVCHHFSVEFVSWHFHRVQTVAKDRQAGLWPHLAWCHVEFDVFIIAKTTTDPQLLKLLKSRCISILLVFL